MFQLIKRELILQKKMLWFGLAYSIFLLLVFHNSNFGQVAYIMAAYAMSYMIIIGAVQVEHKNNTDLVLNSLPITRQEIVQGKYLSVLVFTAIALVIVGVVGLIFHLIPGPFNYRLINFYDVVVTMIAVLFLAGISLPTYFKSIGQWIQVFNVFLFIFIFFVPIQVIEYTVKNSQQPFVAGLARLARWQPWFLSLSGMVVMLLLFFISYFISLRIYLNKDF
ncbi:MAG TPA: ABC-2 transporter permease [Syntrophomonadaceae bacterium]|nr:ABC-2 transporter permease [Syntrophomonadaceae bacterium]